MPISVCQQSSLQKYAESTMADQDTEERVRMMIDMVVSHGLRTTVEDTIGILWFSIGVGLVVFLSAYNMPYGLEGGFLIAVSMVLVINAVPFIVGRLLCRRRKAALLERVMPSDQEGNRTFDEQAYLYLASECRTIGDADFRSSLMKAFRKTL